MFQKGSVFAKIGNGNGRAEMGTSWDEPEQADIEPCALEHSFFGCWHLIYWSAVESGKKIEVEKRNRKIT